MLAFHRTTSAKVRKWGGGYCCELSSAPAGCEPIAKRLANHQAEALGAHELCSARLPNAIAELAGIAATTRLWFGGSNSGSRGGKVGHSH